MSMATEDQQQNGAATTQDPDGGAAATSGAGGGGRSSIFRLLTTTALMLLLLLNYPPTTHGIVPCLVTKDVNGKLEAQTNIENVPRHATPDYDFDWCFLLYNVAAQTTTITERHTYLAGSNDTTFGVDVGCGKPTATFGECQLEETGNKGSSDWRLDFVCCCNSSANKFTSCNMPKTDNNTNAQFETQLNRTDQQICRVDYAQNGRIDNCSRLTNQVESVSASKCRSFLENGGGTPVLGCAHDDGGVDRCEWTKESGVCRRTTSGDVECCCEGALCNGADYMDMNCRAAIKGSGNNFTYGEGNCAVPWPDPTTLPGNGDETTPTTGDDSSDIGLYIGIGLGVALLVLLLIALVVAFVCWRKRKAKKAAAAAPPAGANTGTPAETQDEPTTQLSETKEEQSENYEAADAMEKKDGGDDKEKKSDASKDPNASS